jgi:hypothetical protein
MKGVDLGGEGITGVVGVSDSNESSGGSIKGLCLTVGEASSSSSKTSQSSVCWDGLAKAANNLSLSISWAIVCIIYFKTLHFVVVKIMFRL